MIQSDIFRDSEDSGFDYYAILHSICVFFLAELRCQLTKLEL